MNNPKEIENERLEIENERLDEGLCPKCENSLIKAGQIDGYHSDDKHSVCPECGWEDEY